MHNIEELFMNTFIGIMLSMTIERSHSTSFLKSGPDQIRGSTVLLQGSFVMWKIFSKFHIHENSSMEKTIHQINIIPGRSLEKFMVHNMVYFIVSAKKKHIRKHICRFSFTFFCMIYNRNISMIQHQLINNLFITLKFCNEITKHS